MAKNPVKNGLEYQIRVCAGYELLAHSVVPGGDSDRVQTQGDILELLKVIDTHAPVPHSIEEKPSQTSGRPRDFRYFGIRPENNYYCLYVNLGNGTANWQLIGVATLITITTAWKSELKIEDMVIKQEFRKRGFGRLLLRSAVEWARVQQRYFFIEVSFSPRRGIWMIPWFESHGFILWSRAAQNDFGPGTHMMRLTLV